MQITTTTTNRLHTLVLNDDEFATIEQALSDLTDDATSEEAPLAWKLWREINDAFDEFDIESGAR